MQLSEYLQQQSPTSIIKNIPIGSFKASQFDERGVQTKEENKERSSSPVIMQEGLRLPNISLKGAAESIKNG
jgi:hypothetical protein